MGYHVVTWSPLTRRYREHSANISHSSMRQALQSMVAAYDCGQLDTLPAATFEALTPGMNYVSLDWQACRRDLPVLRQAVDLAEASDHPSAWVLRVLHDATKFAAWTRSTLNYA